MRALKLMPRVDSVLIANNFTLLDHPIEVLELFNECQRRNIRVQLAGVYASGCLASPPEIGQGNYYMYSSDVPSEVSARIRAIL